MQHLHHNINAEDAMIHTCSFRNRLNIGLAKTYLRLFFNPLTTKKQTTKFSSTKFQKKYHSSHIIFRIQRLEGK